jgi:molybdopterin-guanine dinucleotide biosynthesis protein A
MRTTAIVLAGGAASRFGGDKLAAELRGRPVLHHALLAVDAVADGIVVVVGPEDPAPTWPAGLRAEPRLARDAVAHRGPLAGIATGLAWLAPPADDDLALVVAGDMPSLVPKVLRALVGELAADAALAAAWLEADPFAPLPMAIRPAAVAGPIADVLDRERRALRALLDMVPGRALPAATWRALDPAGATLVDIDTRDDLDHGGWPGS